MLKFSTISFVKFDGGNEDIHHRCYMALSEHFGMPCILSDEDIPTLEGMNKGFVVGFYKELKPERSLSLFSSIISAINKNGTIVIDYENLLPATE